MAGAFVDVAQAERGPDLVGRDLGVRPGERRGEGVEDGQALGDDGAPGIEEAGVPEPELGSLGAFLPDRSEQRVALLEDPPVGREIPPVGRRPLAGQGVERRSPQPRRAGHQEHLLGGEDDGPQQSDEPVGAAADTVDPDPLAAPGRAGPAQRELDGVGPPVRPGIVRLDPPLDPGQVGPPPDELDVGRGAV